MWRKFKVSLKADILLLLLSSSSSSSSSSSLKYVRPHWLTRGRNYQPKKNTQ
jgi:hypothetical protein